MRDVDDRPPLSNPIRKKRKYIVFRIGVEHGKRFVQYDHVRIDRDDAGERFFLRLPERQRHGRRRSFMQQTDNGKRFDRAEFDFIGRKSEVLRTESRIAENDAADDLIFRRLKHESRADTARIRNFAALGIEKPAQNPRKRTLSASVQSDDGRV